ncbi:DUF6461 domain-containing protein [Streptomyces sp. NPDC001455]|uniref:DUF6461 domain-containing protein n=1 Tax=unclassified Streptomyces TaxID=2593676 RepID=UPI003330A12D
MTTTAADRMWFEERFPELTAAYCFTSVQGLSPAEVLRRLEGRAGRGSARVVHDTAAAAESTAPGANSG